MAQDSQTNQTGENLSLLGHYHKFPEFSLIFFCVLTKFPEFSLTGKLETPFQGFPWFPEWLGTLSLLYTLHISLLRCTFLSYAAHFSPTLHISLLRCTFLSYAAHFSPTLKISLLRWRFLSYAGEFLSYASQISLPRYDLSCGAAKFLAETVEVKSASIYRRFVLFGNRTQCLVVLSWSPD